MIVYTVKNPLESNDKLLVRYKKMFFQTRVANRLRNSQYAERKTSRRKVRERAIVRAYYRDMNKELAD